MPLRAILPPAVDQRLPTPLYHQIYLILRGQILDGTLSEGAWLPGEEELARQFNVSRITARRALAELAAERLVTRGRGRGTRVSGACPPVSVHGGLEGLIENLLNMGLKTRVALVEFSYEPALPHVAAALRLKPGDEVQRAIRVRSIAEGPFSYLTTFVPAAVGRKFGRRELAREPLLALLERAGIVIGGAEQTISATLADTRVAPFLETAVGAPLVRISRVVHDTAGIPVEFIVALYRPDRYQFRMNLDRVRGGSREIWSAKAPPSPGAAAASSQTSRRERAR